MTNLPIKFKEHLQLTQLGIDKTNIGFTTLALESDKYVCVCDKSGETPQVIIIDVQNPSAMSRHPIKADSARMNPIHNHIALKAGRTIQIYDADQKKKLKQYILPEEVTFWKWISPDAIGLVTESAVYHWTISDSSEAPTKMFDRHESLSGSQIISYKTDSSFQWLALVGISAQQNRIAGSIQLFSVQRNVSQPVEGHACVFCDFPIDGNPHPSNVFCFSVRGATASKLNIIEVGSPPSGNQQFPKKSVELFFPPEAAGDFPISMHSDKRSGIVFIITKMGYIHMYELETGICLFVNRISNDVIFVTAELLTGNGFIGVNRNGSVISVVINGDGIVSYLSEKKMQDIGFKIAARAGFPGAENAFIARFNDFFSRQMYVEAAKVAARSPGTCLRNPQTLAKFQSIQAPQGQPAPILSYFSSLLETTKLNSFESIELCRPVILQGKKNLVEKWLLEDKIECTEELGDLVKSIDLNIALSVYLRGNCHSKVIQCFAEAGQFPKIALYCKKVGFNPDFVSILRLIVRSSPDSGLQFAKSLIDENVDGVDINGIANAFIEANLVQQCTGFLLEALKPNTPESADLQTKLIEMNIIAAPQIADAILTNKTLTHFDKAHIAKLCEQAGLIQHALELYTDVYDIKRAIVQAHLINPEWLVGYFGSLSVEDSISCLHAMLEYNIRQNLQIVVQVAAKYHEQLNTMNLIKIFESFKSSEGLFLFLGSIVNYSQDPDVHFKYIQSAVKTGQLKEVERICKESSVYDAEKVKNFLKESKLTDQIPLIIVCDRFNFVNDLILHLYKNNQIKYIEIYVQKVNPSRLPEIVGSLLDVDCGDEYLKNMIVSCPTNYSLDRLVEEVSKRNRTKLLMPFLESRIANGSTESGVHSALAIVYIDSNNRPENFLRENSYYDPLMVGKYCEKRDSQLACIAYEKGGLDDELIRVCNANALFKNLSRYIIFKKDSELWEKVLDPSNENRRPLIDQSVQSVMADTYDPEAISVMVKSFMAAQLPGELIELLEKLVLNNSRFSSLRNLQNLLFLTAIKADPSRIMEYINRLDNYDAPNIAKVAITSKLYEEAFAIYKKFEVHASAVQVLVENIKSLDRAYEYTERCNVPAAWSVLARGQLSNDMLKEAIDSFIKADDSSFYMDVIETSKRVQNYESLVKYLTMARVTIHDGFVDSEYAFCLAKTGRLDMLEELLNQSNNLSILPTGERCFDNELYEAARIIFKYANNYPRLAATYVKLKEYQAAVDAARKANNIKTWKEVCFSCVEAEEYRFAQVCSLNIVIHPEELDELISFYESKGLFEELLTLIEASVGLERAHMGMFTELAVLYCKYKPSKLKEHLDLFWSRVNIPKVLRAAETSHLWSEMVFLYDKYEEFDNAILTMIRHPGVSFNEPLFRDIISKVANADLYNKAISFYYEFKPMCINDLMLSISLRIDHSKAIAQLKSLKMLPMCKGYLFHVQKLNLAIINEALNALLVEEEAYEELRNSIGLYTNFDAVALAQSLESNQSIEFRRIANLLYKICNRWGQSIDLAKKDGLYSDSIYYASESKDPEIAHSLLDFFIEINRPDCLASLLYVCYDILRPEVVVESCWINGMTDYCMPFLIQTLREFTSKVETIKTNQEIQQNEADSAQPSSILYSPSGPQLMLTGPAGFSASPSGNLFSGRVAPPSFNRPTF